jgi:hypothetical protein
MQLIKGEVMFVRKKKYDKIVEELEALKDDFESMRNSRNIWKSEGEESDAIMEGIVNLIRYGISGEEK